MNEQLFQLERPPVKTPAAQPGKRYLTYISTTYATRNMLEADTLAWLRTFDRKLIAPDALDTFIADVQKGVDKFNAQYHRCQPVKLALGKSPHSKDLYIVWSNAPGLNGHQLCDFKILTGEEAKA